MTRSTLGLYLLASVALLAGWWTMWFLCDDAYIAFRYVRMAQEGHGFTWNAPPFRPVEGYSSFAWVMLLHLIWTVAGVAPPVSANPLSLLCSLGALAVVFRLANRLPTQGSKPIWIALVALAVVTNRSWLIWTSSGLETALWTVALLSWVEMGTRDRPRLLGWLTITACLPLIRPDGLLYLAVTPVLVAHLILSTRRVQRTDAVLLLPYALPVLHLVWRWSTYGFWLPNTYYAKVVDPWPLMGALFAALFAYDHLFWIPGLVILYAAWRVRPARGPVLVVGVVLAQLLFLLRAGGDHFGYRIFVHWVPLVWLGFAWALLQLPLANRTRWAAFGIVWLLGLPVPWTHHAITSGSGNTFWELPHQEIAPSFPRVVQPWPALRDWVARWQQYHLVGTPHHLHRAFLDVQIRRFPSQTDVERFGEQDFPVWAHPNPGYAAYHLPDVAVLDMLGLNDAVIARTAPPPNRKRRLAHEHLPPAGYIACFAPNVTLTADTVMAFRRDQPFDADTIRRCEDLWWDKVRR